MKQALFFLLTLGASLHIAAQDGPKIEFPNGATLDYGTVSKGEDSGIRQIEIKNSGNQPLIITNVQSTCGCTIPTKPKAPIMPGKTDFIEVKYNMNPGPIRKTITVESNAVNYPEGRVPLKIKGEVIIKTETSPLEKKKPMVAQ
jgi:hypothetical protein